MKINRFILSRITIFSYTNIAETTELNYLKSYCQEYRNNGPYKIYNYFLLKGCLNS